MKAIAIFIVVFVIVIFMLLLIFLGIMTFDEMREFMKIEFSELIAFFSLVVAFIAYTHSVESAKSNSRQVQRIADNQLQLSENIALSEAGQKYVLLVSEISYKFEKIANDVGGQAREAIQKIGEVFDKYDMKEMSSPYLRHAYHHNIQIVRECFDNEMTYQTGMYITANLRFFIMDINRHVLTPVDDNKSWFSFFIRSKKLQSPEDKINHTKEFWRNIKTIYERIPLTKEADLFSEVFEHIQGYIEEHEKISDKLDVFLEQLKNARNENSLELFKIHNTPYLGKNFDKIEGDIGRFKELYFPEFYGIKDVHVSDGIVKSLYAGSIMYIASQRFRWGESRKYI